MPKKSVEWWVSKLNQTIAGQKVIRGQLIRPGGNRNDHLIFQDNTHWAYRFDGEPVLCDTDGCHALFASEAALREHRRIVHGPERDYREQRGAEARSEVTRRELEGETVGGHPIEKMVPGPRGPVPYIG